MANINSERESKMSHKITYRRALILWPSAQAINKCISCSTSKRYVCAFDIFLDGLTKPFSHNFLMAFWAVLKSTHAALANIGIVCSMFPTYSDWSNTFATGPPKTSVKGPFFILFNSHTHSSAWYSD